MTEPPVWADSDAVPGGLGKFRYTGLERADMDACGSPQARPAHGGESGDPAGPYPAPRPCSPMPTGRSPPVLLLPGRLACSLLEAANHSLTMGAAGPLPPSPLPAVRFGHQAATDVAFTILLPLTLTWTRSGRALVGTFCHLDPSLASLTFYASSRLLTRTAADCWASPL